MKKVIIICLLVMSMQYIYSLTGADAVYRTGSFTFGCNHAALYAGNAQVYEMPGAGDNVELHDWSTFIGNEDYLGAYYNPDMSDNDRQNILMLASVLESDPDISYTCFYAMACENNVGNIINPWEVTDFRCDGLVEYAYEYMGVPVWAISTATSLENDHYPNAFGSPNPHRWDISNPDYLNEHNNLGYIFPYEELSPKVQRGGSGAQYTQLVPAFSRPNLIVENTTVNSNSVSVYAYPGDNLSISCRVKNIGNATAEGGRVGYYWGNNANDVSNIIDYDTYSDLNSNSYSNESENWTIPTSTTPGIYYLNFYADYQNTESNESNEDDNSDEYVKVYVQQMFYIDLIIQNEEVNDQSNSVTVHPGDNLSISCRVKNIGNATAEGGRVGYYWGNNSSDFSERIDYDSYSDLSPNSYSDESENWTVPTSTTPGTYYLNFYADYQNTESNESDESNNDDEYVIVYVQQASYPDLIIQNEEVNDQSNSVTVHPGDNLSISCRVKNIGNATAEGGRVGYYWGNNSSDFSERIDYDSYSDLSPNSYSDESENWTVPTSTTPGTYYLNFYADYQNTESNESDESNNDDEYVIVYVQQASYPDLIIQNEKVNDQSNSVTIHPGDNLSISCRVKNIGNATAEGGKVGYYWGNNSSDFSYLIDYDLYSDLSSNNYSDESENWTVPTSTTPGTYYLNFYADYQDTESNESNESNNNDEYVIVYVEILGPSVPDNVQIVVRGNLLGLQWNPVIGASQYRIEASNSPTNGFSSLGTTSNTFCILNVTSSLKFYRIIAINSSISKK